MNDAAGRWAGFAYGLDALCFPPSAAGPAALVRAGSAEAAWAARALPPERVATYRLSPEAAPEEVDTTAGVLASSDVAAVLRASGVDRLLLSCSPATAIEHWSRRERIGLISPPGALARRLEDKLFFHRLLHSLEIPQPPGGPVAANAPPPVEGFPWVVQVPDSLGGEGTFFLRTPQDWRDWRSNRPVVEGELLLGRKLLSGRTYGVGLLVSDASAKASALRVQAYLPSPAAAESQWFAGIQWVSTSDLSAKSLADLNASLEKLGLWLHSQGFRGAANFDFLVDESGDPYFLECNPRLSAATPQWLLQEETGGGAAAAAELLGLWAPGRVAASDGPPKYISVPPSNFLGAAVEVAPWLSGRDGTSALQSAPGGMYRTAAPPGEGPKLAFVAPPLDFAGEGDLFFLPVGDAVSAAPCTASRGSVLSRIPCFDPAGRLLPLGRTIGRELLTAVAAKKSR